MTRPESTKQGALFDLATADREMRLEDAYARVGHTARTLVREPDLRIILIVMKAGSRIAEHHTSETVSIHALTGHITVRLPDRVVDLPAGRLLVLERDLRHDVDALAESAFLLTIGWRESR